MENVIFYGRKSSGKEQIVDYCLIEESIGEGSTGMHRYGIRIISARIFHGGGKTVDMKQLNNVFYRYNDADEFMRSLMNHNVLPEELNAYVQDYIAQRICA